MELNSEDDIVKQSSTYSGSDNLISLSGLSDEIKCLADDLESVNGKTEVEFLSIGSNLNDFYSRVTEISTTASSSAELILGKEIARAIGDFQGLQDRVSGYLNRIKTEMDHCMVKLRDILKMIKSIKNPGKDLKEIAQMLQMLAISTRIVTVKLSRRDSSFNALADNIKSMSKLINSKSSDILEQAKSLSYLVNNAITTLRSLEDRQAVLAGDILNNTSLGLGAVKNMKNKSTDAAGITNVISGRSSEISGNLSEIMVSLQFHDITHQKIDQASGALKSLKEMLKKEDAEAGDDKRLESLSQVLGNCRLLKSDILSVKSELVTAVDDIINNLRGIARNVAHLSSDIGNAAGAVSEDYSAFWLEMDQVMSSFTTSIREDADTSGKLSEVMSSVAGTVSNISLYVSDIEEIGSDIRLIAFNARIKAAHVGKEGASVGLLAEKIQKLSVDAAIKTSIILKTLKGISTYAKELSAYEASGTKIEEVGLDDVVSRLIDILNPLHMVDDKIISHLNTMDTNSNELVKDIDTLIGGITVHDKSSRILGSVVEDIDDIEMKIVGSCPGVEALPVSELAAEKGKEKEEEKGGENGLGENIELF
ncbi:MAG: methyl-accepting chemotaxis protein [Deltaproteobacteria bacterium]|nr:methyl-accepting chemotaxis protein [Deltaproteobacteria bacterium]